MALNRAQRAAGTKVVAIERTLAGSVDEWEALELENGALKTVGSISGVVETNETQYSSWAAYAEQVTSQNVVGENLTAHAVTGSFTVVAEPTNTGLVFLGNSAGTCYVPLAAGSAMSFSIGNTNLVWFRTPTTGDGVIVFVWTL